MENKNTNNKWQKHEDFVEQEILNLSDKYIWVDKPTQVGLTTSLVKVCIKKGLKITHFAPTNMIIEDTLGNIIMEGRDYGRIGNNKSMCPNAKKDIFFDMHNSSCLKCADFEKGGKCKDGKCEYRWNVDNNFSVIGLTYEKFRSLIRRKYEEGDKKFEHSMDFFKDKLMKKILESDIILLDEFPRLIVYKPQGFFVDDLEKAFNLVKIRTDALILNIIQDKHMDLEKKQKKIEKYNEMIKTLELFKNSIINMPLDLFKIFIRKDKDGNNSYKLVSFGKYMNTPLELPEAGTLGYTTMKSLIELKNYVDEIFGFKEGDGRVST